ncbi:MAG: hypothetical protein HYT62_00700 [Candidatus Yanofskybacteria bacterium]|nr:hypothetical protein [Candidatus Yanofskybacteria bacterium]
MAKIKVSVQVDGKTESAEISGDLYEILRDGASLRNRPIELYLFLAIKRYGVLTEETIRVFLEEYWIL